jgi:predicted metal-binding membrane protein
VSCEGDHFEFGVVVLAAENLLRPAVALDGSAALAGALVGAGAWQLTRTKRRALYACGRTVPLPPLGRRADAACARFGVIEAGRCMRSCWPLMVAATLVRDAAPLWMIGFAAFIALEELTLAGRRLVRWSCVALAVAAGAVLAGV